MPEEFKNLFLDRNMAHQQEIEQIVLSSMDGMSRESNDNLVKSYNETKAIVIELKINGQEVSIIGFLKHIDRNIDQLVEHKALELMREKMEKFHDAIQSMTDIAERVDSEMKVALNIHEDE